MLYEEKIMKFDPTNGAKAYSYFGTIVKRWLINYNNKNYKKLKQIGSFDDIEESYDQVIDLDSPSGKTLSNFMNAWIDSIYMKIDDMFIKDTDIQIADAVLTLFRTRHDLDIFKKKALYIYIREMTDCETPQLTKVITVLKEDFKENYQKLYDQGLLSQNNI
jgi:hypothetical protein